MPTRASRSRASEICSGVVADEHRIGRQSQDRARPGSKLSSQWNADRVGHVPGGKLILMTNVYCSHTLRDAMLQVCWRYQV